MKENVVEQSSNSSNGLNMKGHSSVGQPYLAYVSQKGKRDKSKNNKT